MKIIKIKTQEELDDLPKSFDEYTQIQIFGGTIYNRIIVKVARENSSVVAWENSSVVAWENSSVKVFSSYADIKKIKQEAVAIFIDCKPKIGEVDNKKHLIYTQKAKHDIESFIGIHKLEVKENKIILFKSVNPDTLCDFRTGKIKYEGIVKCPDFDPNPEIECGYGLHLSPTAKLALSFNQGTVLKCEVDLKDIVVYHGNIEKVRCKKVKVLPH